MTPPPIDLGHDHTLKWVSWAPDRELNPGFADMPDDERAGAIVQHKKPDGTECVGGFITFPGSPIAAGDLATWQVESWDPLTLSPSLLCRICGDHGFVRNGQWVPA